MKTEPGLYFHEATSGHTWGVEAVNSSEIYHKLSGFFYKHGYEKKWFRQGDSNFRGVGDSSWLFIEFLGQNLNNREEALEQAQKIARKLGVELKIL